MVSLLLLAGTFFGAARSQTTNSPITPLSIPPSEYWDGNDGWWSTFQVRVGTPGQTLRLLPATSASAGDTSWVVVDEGCSILNSNLTNCANDRGYLFHRNKSTSWSTEGLANGGLYSLTVFEEGYLGLGGNAYYGFDSFSLGLSGSGLPTLSNQIIAGFATNDFWLGTLGLSPIPFNFTDLNNPQPSLLGTLYNESLVPSISWAYTAGAHYLSTPVYGSLILGGYDTTRFTPNDVVFTFGADFSRDLLVKLTSITYDTLGSSPLLAIKIDIFIDSMVTYMWLPEDVCDAFEQAFNLTWDSTTEMYLLRDDTHSSLVVQNPTFTFTIGNGTDGHTVDIVFPYSAFDLNVTQPVVDSETRYFPLKRATNSTQYTLGRVFLQEAYVVADYGRQTFSVSQALFPSTGTAEDIVTIWPPGIDSNFKENKLGSGTIAGIVIGAVAGLALIGGLIWWLSHRRKHHEAGTNMIEVAPEADSVQRTQKHVLELGDQDNMIQEMEAMHSELDAKNGSSGRHELASQDKVHEMGEGRAQPVELEAPLR